VTGDPERQAGDVAACLPGVLEVMDTGELDATDVQRAHLAGAVAALEWVTGQRSTPLFYVLRTLCSATRASACRSRAEGWHV
jgi:hypothetical protein